jgi:uncharacterized protein
MTLGFRRFSRVILATLAAVLLLPVLVSALDVPPVPRDVPIVDQTNTLTQEQITALAQIIADERKATGNQIGVLMIPSLQGEAVEDYSLKVARAWGIGQKERNSGVLLFVAKDDRKLRIEVGYGLEGALPDIRANHIIQDRITPEFRQGKYFEGIQSGLVGITTAIHGEADPKLSAQSAPQKGLPWDFIIFGSFIVISWLGAILGRTKSWWAGGVVGAVAGIVIGVIFGFMIIGVIAIIGLAVVGLIFDKAVSANYQRRVAEGGLPAWWAGGTHIGGGPSGGFGGFSGGSFGGGGSSGSW